MEALPFVANSALGAALAFGVDFAEMSVDSSVHFFPGFGLDGVERASFDFPLEAK